MLRILLPTNAKTREKFYFLHQNLSMLRVLITGLKQTCFELVFNSCVWRDSRIILSNQDSVFLQLATLNLISVLQDRFDLWIITRATSLCTSAVSCYPFHLTFSLVFKVRVFGTRNDLFSL